MTNETLEQKYVKRLKEVAKVHENDLEVMHVLADRIIIAALDELGFHNLVEEFNLITKDCYYA